MLITFEGLDLMGKSTLIRGLADVLYGTTITKEPGSFHVPKSPELRALALGEGLEPFQREMIFYADALGHKTWLEKQGGLVLCDRGSWSHYAYIYGYMKLGKLGKDADENYTRYSLGKKLIRQCCAEPDAVIYLEGSISLMEKRLYREKDAIESLGSEYFSYVLAAYDDLCVQRELEQKPLLIMNAEDSLEDNVNKSYKFIQSLHA